MHQTHRFRSFHAKRRTLVIGKHAHLVNIHKEGVMPIHSLEELRHSTAKKCSVACSL